jgi:hypothetical protein
VGALSKCFIAVFIFRPKTQAKDAPGCQGRAASSLGSRPVRPMRVQRLTSSVFDF